MNTHRLLQPAVALLALSAAATSTSALAQEAGDWTLRARVVHMDMSYGSRTAANLGIKNRWIPEVNLGYAISPSFSLELVLPGTQKEDVTSGGSKIGTIKHHSPSLLLQYRYRGLESLTPYIGAGVTHTRFRDVKLFPPGVDIERRSTGFAWQFGLDVPITEHLSFNFDAKQLRIETDVTAGFGQVPLGTLEMKPWLVGVGLGWTF